jgi:hypothetical protein
METDNGLDKSIRGPAPIKHQELSLLQLESPCALPGGS